MGVFIHKRSILRSRSSPGRRSPGPGKAVRNTPTGWGYLRQRVEQLLDHGLATQLDTLWREPAVPDDSLLKAFRGRALVLGCVGDDLHPVAVAERLAGLLPGADLQVYDHPAVLWSNRRELRERISEFLNTP